MPIYMNDADTIRFSHEGVDYSVTHHMNVR